MSKFSCVLSVLGKDRAGIVSTISTTLFESGANIDDIRQTILDDMFAMTMLVTVDETACTFNDLQEKLARDAEALNVQVTLQRKDVFDYMYSI
jgi:ACT domain-containing protein